MKGTKGLWVLAAAIWIVALSTLGSASGHPADDFYDWEPGAGLDLWAGASPDVDAHFAANEVGPTRETSVRVAFNKWGSVSGAPFSFSFGADRTNYSAWDRIDCSPDPTNTIHWDTSIPNSTGFDSFSTVCLTGDNITEFQTVFDDNSGVTWHNDDSNPPAGTLDLRSLAAHEAGHVTGGWLGESVFGHFNDNSGECPNNSNRETMCATTIFGTDWARTLSNHDEHTFANAY